MDMTPSMPIIKNQMSMTGPKNLPTNFVPNCWMMNSAVMMAMTKGTVSIWLLKYRNPSTADDTEMAGVMTPSDSSELPPMMVGTMSHFNLTLRTSVYSEKIPPSPLLSARNVRTTYFIVV